MTAVLPCLSAPLWWIPLTSASKQLGQSIWDRSQGGSLGISSLKTLLKHRGLGSCVIEDRQCLTPILKTYNTCYWERQLARGIFNVRVVLSVTQNPRHSKTSGLTLMAFLVATSKLDYQLSYSIKFRFQSLTLQVPSELKTPNSL